MNNFLPSKEVFTHKAVIRESEVIYLKIEQAKEIINMINKKNSWIFINGDAYKPRDVRIAKVKEGEGRGGAITWTEDKLTGESMVIEGKRRDVWQFTQYENVQQRGTTIVDPKVIAEYKGYYDDNGKVIKL